jgi:hypothetical protein
MNGGRYAVYFAPPPDSAWAQFAECWFADSDFAKQTVEPRRYGFHATLKAPFRLKEGDSETLLRAVTALAGRLRRVPMGVLVPVYMDGFVALVPSVLNRALDAVAARCAIELDPLRAPLTPLEYARRQPEKLDARGRELLDQYGYPYVLERFRFHMSLTGPVEGALAGRVVAQLAASLARLNAQAPPVLDRLCVFHEPVAGAAFIRLRDVELRP